VKIERRHAVLFLVLAVWNVVIWTTFARNLGEAHARGEDRPNGYWVAHLVLIVVNLVVAGILGRLGVQAWRATTRAGQEMAGR
jgi:hypothetical protein